MPVARFTMTGSDQLVANLRTSSRRSAKAAERAVYEFGETEMREMKKRTPVDTGALRNSGFVEKPTRVGTKVSVSLGFGGQADAYAIFVHEDLDVFHRVGEAKFVESVLNESMRYFTARVVSSIMADLGM